MPDRRTTRRRFTRLARAGAVLLLALLLGCLYQLHAHLRLQAEVERQLGFQYATPYYGGPPEEVFLITHVTPGSPLHAAGLRPNDCVRYTSVDNLFYALVTHQGQVATIPIQRRRQLLDLAVRVPALTLSVKPERLWWDLRPARVTFRQAP